MNRYNYSDDYGHTAHSAHGSHLCTVAYGRRRCSAGTLLGAAYAQALDLGALDHVAH